MQGLRISGLCTAALIALFSSAALAQESAGSYPSKPVTMLVVLAAGGPNDQEARLYAPKMNESLGQPFVLDFKPGAAGTIGTAYAAKAAPDGYTLLVVTGSFAIFPSLYKNLTFDTLKDFAAVSLMSKRATVLLVNPAFPAKTMQDYIAYAKANPGKINYGTSGSGNITHISGAWLHGVTNTKVTYIHYNSTPTLMLDLVAGRLDVTPVNLIVALPLIKAGKVRPLANTDDRRSKLLPDLPTIAEQGIPDFNYANWLGFVAPSATPTPIINKLNEAFTKASKEPDIVATLEAQGSTMVGSTPAQFRQLLVTETARWHKVVQDNGIVLE